MRQYSIQPRDQIFVKSYVFLSFAKNMAKNIGKNISKNFCGKYSPGMLAMRRKFLDHAKQSATDAFKTASKKAIQETAEATGDLTGNEIVKKITRVSKNSQPNNSHIVTNELDKEIPKEMYISPEKRQEIIDDLRLK